MSIGMIDRAMTAAERQKRWRDAHKKPGRKRRAADDIGPAIAEGEPFTDNFDKTEAAWTRLMAGARFSDVDVVRF